MKKFADILGAPAINHMPKIDALTSLFHGLLARIGNEQSRRLLARCYKGIAILILNALVFCAGLDLAARISFKIRGLISSPAQQLVGEGNPREQVSYYSSQDWAERYWYEFRLSDKERYYPYVGWRRAPFKGETIQINKNGVRVTPGAECSAESFKVFAFGDSSMWGTGSPDWDTIPANLQKGFEKLRETPVCVMNFAESAYVSTQDIIMLLMQLQSGNIPDLVLFYNIGGDIPAGYQSGRPGVHANFNEIASKFEERKQPVTILDLLRSTYLYSLIDELMDKLTIANPKQKEPAPSKLATETTTRIDIKELSGRIAQNYLGDYKIVSALAQKYGFKYFYFLPPSILLGNKPLTLEEQEMKRKAENDAAFKKLYVTVYQTIERESWKYQNLYSMVHVFDNCDWLIWIDAGHVTPIGNQMIAQKMMDIIKGAAL